MKFVVLLRRLFAAFAGIVFVFITSLAQGQVLTVQVGSPPQPPTVVSNVLAGHGDDWHWRRGTNAPQANWMTVASSGLDSTWALAPGGFGYGDNAIVGEATHVDPGMLNVHTTLYIRIPITVPTALSTNASLILTADYDDGFVAYLDGTELARRNVPGTPGTPVSNTATTGGVSHEASCCNSPNPPTPINLGSAATLLPPGQHVLAIIGVNQVASSSDFHLIMDLAAVQVINNSTNDNSVVNNGYYALSTTNTLLLTGTNTFAGSTRVTVNGDVADFNAGQGTWSRVHTLRPGWNRLFIAAHDANGNILGNIVQDVIYQTVSASVPAVINGSLVHTNPGTVLRVPSAVTVSGGGDFTVGNGVVVLVSAGQGITASGGGQIHVLGNDADRVYFRPDGGTNISWGPLSAAGAGSVLEIHYADVGQSQVNAQGGAAGRFFDSEFHDFDNPSGGTLGRPIVMSSFAGEFLVKRCHVYNYYECLSRDGLVHYEDSIFEHMIGDAVDFDSAAPGSHHKRNTFRHGNLGNVDAIDLGPSGTGGCTNTLIESCLMWDFPFDKGVSIGDNGSGVHILVTNCVIYGCDSGVAVKDSCSAMIANCTIVDNDYGINLKAKFPTTPPGIGGTVTNSFNNIIWASKILPIWVTNSATILLDYSDVEGNWPGTGNFSADPLFVNAAIRNYQLTAGSPCLGSGANGANMGAHYPVGGIGRPPLNLAATSVTSNALTLRWVDDTENEDGVLVERSLDGTTWTVRAMAPANATSYTDTGLDEGTTYAYRVRTTNWAGISAAGNIAKATTSVNLTEVGGPLNADTTWSGTVHVLANVTVPGPFTLTIAPGTIVQLTNNVGISASAGGHIDVQGTSARPVKFDRLNTTFTRWGDLVATGSGSTLTVRHAKITRGRVRANSAGTTLVEDSELSDITTTGIIGGSGGALFTVRRTWVHDYEDIDLGNTRTLAEDSLFERANSDIFELQNSPSGSILRRCTFRTCLNPNSDGVDMNGCHDVLLDSCLIYAVTDKGISSGSALSASDPTSFGLVVSNSLIHNADIGIGIKDAGTASLFNNTFTGTREGVAVYAKFTAEGGHVTNGFNNLIWGVNNAIRATNGGTVAIEFSDTEGAIWPGTGNISADPLWRDAANGDLRLGTGSPCRSAGANGADIGAPVPVGAPMAPSQPSVQSIAFENGEIILRFWTDYARTYTLQSSSSPAGPWTKVADYSPTTPTFVETMQGASATRFFRLVSPKQ